MENIEIKKKVGRPKGSIKKNKREKVYSVKFMLNDDEEKMILDTFKTMKMDINKTGAKKKMFFKLMSDFLKENQ